MIVLHQVFLIAEILLEFFATSDPKPVQVERKGPLVG